MTGPFVPIEELAKHFSVSVSTIRAWVRQGNIPKDTYIKVGNTYRFCVGDVSKGTGVTNYPYK
jgi:excisionase family DNA binding protein